MSKTKTVFLALAIVFAYGVFHWSNAQLAKQPTTMQVLTPKLANLGYKDNEILLVVPENLDGFPKSKTYQRISDLLTKTGLKLLGRVPLANIPLLNPRFARVCGGLLERWILPSGEVLNTVKTLN